MGFNANFEDADYATPDEQIWRARRFRAADGTDVFLRRPFAEIFLKRSYETETEVGHNVLK